MRLWDPARDGGSRQLLLLSIQKYLPRGPLHGACVDTDGLEVRVQAIISGIVGMADVTGHAFDRHEI